jgi:hypothetical protein
MRRWRSKTYRAAQARSFPLVSNLHVHVPQMTKRRRKNIVSRLAKMGPADRALLTEELAVGESLTGVAAPGTLRPEKRASTKQWSWCSSGEGERMTSTSVIRP